MVGPWAWGLGWPSSGLYWWWGYLLWVNSLPIDIMWHFHCFLALGFELRTLHLLGRCSIAWAIPPALFTLIILEMGSCFLPRSAWTMTFPIYASQGFILCHSTGTDRTVIKLSLSSQNHSFKDLRTPPCTRGLDNFPCCQRRPHLDPKRFILAQCLCLSRT
jgi:hypothetical protein